MRKGRRLRIYALDGRIQAVQEHTTCELHDSHKRVHVPDQGRRVLYRILRAFRDFGHCNLESAVRSDLDDVISLWC